MLGIEDLNTADTGLPDRDWVFEKASSLFRYARIKYQLHGRGAIVINRFNILKPPVYLTLEETKVQDKFPTLQEFEEKYDPDTGFVLLLEQPDGNGVIRRVDFLPQD